MNMLLLIVFFALRVHSTSNIFIFWGYPTDGADACANTTSSSFDACVAYCDNSTTCLLAYGNDAYCMLCDLFSVDQIVQSDQSTGVKTAIKLDEGTCPASMESEEYTGTNINNNTYTLSYSSDLWTISYGELKCIDSTWTKFYRPAGQFCLKVFGSSSTVARNVSVANCLSLGTNLAGIQSQTEMDFITAQSKSYSGNLTKYLYTATWVNGLRPESCNVNKSELLPACAGLKSFVISDQFMTSTSMYNFAPGYPDSVIDRGTRRNCLQIYMSQSATAWQGLLADAVCFYGCNTNSSICATSYVCGAAAF